MNKAEAIGAMMAGGEIDDSYFGYFFFDPEDCYFKKYTEGEGCADFNLNNMSISCDYKLREKPKKKIKLYKFVTVNGKNTDLYYTEDLKGCWSGKKIVRDLACQHNVNWKQTNSFITVEE